MEARDGLAGNTMASNSDIVGEELDSDYDKPYKYESEAFNSPVSDDDENITAFNAFNEETEYGKVEFNVGQTFITMKSFKNALKDYFVYEGKDVTCLNNEKKRVMAACAGENCPWLILTSWNSAEGIIRLLTQPELKPKQAREYMIEEYNVHLSEKMTNRGLKVAREIVIGNEQAQYEKLRDYLMELHKSNPGSTAMIDVIPQLESLPLFNKLYISLDACKRGFKDGCRPLIGLDGCFLKGVGIGLKGDISEAHHKNCVLHIWKNFIKHFKDEETKQLVWKCARFTTHTELAAAMEKLKRVSAPAWEYMQKFEPAVWCKAYFSHGPKVDNITNNMCEVWNAKIVENRKKPILTMYKGLRAIWAGDSERVIFEVHSQNHKVGVNLHKRTCTCNIWQLAGMPCRHAIAALAKMGLKAEDFVHKWLTMEAIRATYSHCIKPVNSE
ncbi:hypothetical protein AHAS_Ahas17G0300900 [Arachis hypogaea]